MNKVVGGAPYGAKEASRGEVLFTAYRRAVAVKPTATDDWFLIREHKEVLVKHLNVALAEIGCTAGDFAVIDPDQYMVDLRSGFDPLLSSSAIQDVFADAFYAALTRLGTEPITHAKCLPSGASVQS